MDVNANRCREALRVVEEYARFALGNRRYASGIKRLRHEVRAASDRLLQPFGPPSAYRDAESDPGPSIKPPPQAVRGGLVDLVRANCRRASEALRVLEETASLVLPVMRSDFEHFRFRVYILESELMDLAG